MDVSQLGEFGLIERLTRIVGAEGSPDLIVGPGDDAAVWRVGSEYLIATTDAMIEGVHFLPERARWQDVGWKALAANLSDIAAMGGTPLFALVTLALPPETPAESMDALYSGLGEAAREHSVIIAGGDIVRAPQVSVTVALMGRATQRDGEPLVLRRSTARPGDIIAVTGTLGDSAAGLRLLKAGAATDPIVQRHTRPVARIAAGRAAVGAGLRCGIDVSDGLLQDVGHVCEMSNAGAVLRAADLPLSDGLLAAFPDDALELACTGGEDYELLVIGAEAAVSRVPDVTVIGEIVEGPPRAMLVDSDGSEIKFANAGWDAFRS
ncbi:MAG: thiamine-phosphate kinase [Chloroflexi bacterium]|nr:thiamine-phosphate kinase [Chloroflexota bacterium]